MKDSTRFRAALQLAVDALNEIEDRSDHESDKGRCPTCIARLTLNEIAGRYGFDLVLPTPAPGGARAVTSALPDASAEWLA